MKRIIASPFGASEVFNGPRRNMRNNDTKRFEAYKDAFTLPRAMEFNEFKRSKPADKFVFCRDIGK